MDGVGSSSRGKVFVLGATNRPQALDSALLRPGRFDRTVKIDLPNKYDKVELFKRFASYGSRGNAFRDTSLLKIIESSNQCLTCADIKAICREAAMIALRENFEDPDVTMEHLKLSAEKYLKPTFVQQYI
mmetsp:Transcript_10324/g.15472  ORF Transcript_10324/g.15472 Transcript_10324/m.15472 type:complete len:130 (+) Transcript_10324:640-1029(+)